LTLKRFITYLYEYKQGRKTKNAGFARVDIRDDVVNIEVCLKNTFRADKGGYIYGLVHKQECIGINFGEIVFKNGECCNRFSFPKNHIANSPYSISDMIGMAISFRSGLYLASCWKDEWAEEIGSGEFSVLQGEEDTEEETVEEVVEKNVQPMMEELPLQTNQIQQEKNENPTSTIAYKKIEVGQIRELPSANWHLDNNSFLRHGVSNYGFLFIKKEIREDEEVVWLGVPGYFEKPEMLMALLFGFPIFEPIPKSVVNMDMNVETNIAYENEKNQQPKNGLFGGWFVKLEE